MQCMAPCVLTLVSLPAGVLAIVLFHQVAGLLVPHLYGHGFSSDIDRLYMLLPVLSAGILGDLAVAGVARRRL